MYDIPAAILVTGLWLILMDFIGYYVTRWIIPGWPDFTEPPPADPSVEDTQPVRVSDNYAVSPNASPTYIISPMPRKD